METNYIQIILNTIPKFDSSTTIYSDSTSAIKRQLVVTTLLELYRAEASAGNAVSIMTIGRNLQHIESHIDLLMNALEPTD